MLADGRPYLFGPKPTAADLAVYHVIWFARQNGGPEIEALLPFSGLKVVRPCLRDRPWQGDAPAPEEAILRSDRSICIFLGSVSKSGQRIRHHRPK